MAESLRDKARRKAEEKAQGHKSAGGYLKLPDGVEYYEAKKSEKGSRSEMDMVVYRVAAAHNPEAAPGELWYERTFYVHSNIGAEKGRKYICPLKTFKKRCPVCEARQSLIKEGYDKNKVLIGDLRPRERQIFNIDTGKTTQIFEASYFTFGQHLEKEFSEGEADWAGFAGLVGGFTLKVRFDETALGENKFLEAGRIDFIPRGNYDESILKEMVDLDACLVELDYEMLNKIFLEIEEEGAAGGGEANTTQQTVTATRQRAPRQEAGQGPVAAEQPRRGRATTAQPGPAPAGRPTRTRTTAAAPPPPPPPQAPIAGSETCPGVKDNEAPGEFAKDCDTLNHCPDCTIWETCRDAADRLVATRTR